MANTKITSKVIADANILTAAIADNAVTGDKVADDVALAGNPTTTTQTAGNSTTRIATTAFVSTAISNLVDSSPAALNTLNELAAALGDDANFSTTVTNSIATKVALSGSGQTIADSGNFTLDVTGELKLDADGGNITLQDGGTAIGQFQLNETNHLKLGSKVSDADIRFFGTDGGSLITALILDMSDAGTAIFNHDIKLADNGIARFGAGEDLLVFHDGSNNYIISNTQDQDLLIQGNDGGSTITALSFDMSAGGAATFNKPMTVDGHSSSLASIFEGNGNGDTVPLQLKVKANNGTTSTQGLYGNAGSASTDNTIVLGNSGTSGIAVDNGGKVGINYTSPSSDLHILGLDGTSSAKITVQTDDTASAKASLLLMSRNASNTNKSWELINDEGYGVGISRTTTGPYGIRKMASTTTVSAGDGWVVLTGFTTNPSDLGTHFSNGVFTAPVTGIYSIGSHFQLYSIGSTNYFLVKGNHLNSSGSGLQEYYVAHTEYTEGSGDSHNDYNYDAYQALNLYMSKGDIYRYEAFAGSANGQITTASYFSVCLIG